MAEVLGVIGGVASLVALAQETFQACNKLAKFVKLYKNASSDISGLCDELSDLSQTISLVQVALQTSRDLSVPDEDAAIGIERTLAGLQKDLDAIEKTITASQHQPTSRKNAKARLKWAFKRTDIISAMTTIGRKKQTLLTKLSLMHMYVHLPTIGLCNFSTSHSIGTSLKLALLSPMYMEANSTK